SQGDRRPSNRATAKRSGAVRAIRQNRKGGKWLHRDNARSSRVVSSLSKRGHRIPADALPDRGRKLELGNGKPRWNFYRHARARCSISQTSDGLAGGEEIE